MRGSPSVSGRGIQLDRVCAGYGGRRVFDGLSAEFPSGALTMLLGPNGSGKSTLLRLLGGALPFSGNAVLAGRSLRRLSSGQRGKLVGMVSQSPSLSFPFTVEEVVLLGRLPHRKFLSGWTTEDRGCAMEAVREMELGEMLFRRVSSLSGGEKQRVLIAQVIAQQPEVFLLDEPSSALDPRYTLRLFRFLRKCAREGATVVAAVHDINLAAEYADSVCFLKNGRIEAFGDVEEALNDSVLSSVYDVPFASFGADLREDGRWRRVWRAV